MVASWLTSSSPRRNREHNRDSERMIEKSRAVDTTANPTTPSPSFSFKSRTVQPKSHLIHYPPSRDPLTWALLSSSEAKMMSFPLIIHTSRPSPIAIDMIGKQPCHRRYIKNARNGYTQIRCRKCYACATFRLFLPQPPCSLNSEYTTPLPPPASTSTASPPSSRQQPRQTSPDPPCDTRSPSPSWTYSAGDHAPQ